MLRGNRKFILGLLYIACAPGLVFLTGGVDGVASILVATATGVTAIVAGNVLEHRANGAK